LSIGETVLASSRILKAPEPPRHPEPLQRFALANLKGLLAAFGCVRQLQLGFPERDAMIGLRRHRSMMSESGSN